MKVIRNIRAPRSESERVKMIDLIQSAIDRVVLESGFDITIKVSSRHLAPRAYVEIHNAIDPSGEFWTVTSRDPKNRDEIEFRASKIVIPGYERYIGDPV